MDIDDVQVGRILSRREILGLFGAAGAALLVGCSDSGKDASSGQPASAAGGSTAETAAVATSASGASTAAVSTAMPSCVVVPALTEGPYFVDEKINRADIRSDPSNGSVRPGVPLTLAVNVSRVSGGSCTALPGAVVDVWHCDALGVYSDVTDQGFNTKGQKFLRGYQTTDANGRVQFTTVYPGWYQGRAVHIHFKIRTGGTEFTSQWFFDEAVSDAVFKLAPYASKTGSRLKNDGDGIYRQSNGMLTLSPQKSGEGYAATFDIGLRA